MSALHLPNVSWAPDPTQPRTLEELLAQIAPSEPMPSRPLPMPVSAMVPERAPQVSTMTPLDRLALAIRDAMSSMPPINPMAPTGDQFGQGLVRGVAGGWAGGQVRDLAKRQTQNEQAVEAAKLRDEANLRAQEQFSKRTFEAGQQKKQLEGEKEIAGIKAQTETQQQERAIQARATEDAKDRAARREEWRSKLGLIDRLSPRDQVAANRLSARIQSLESRIGQVMQARANRLADTTAQGARPEVIQSIEVIYDEPLAKLQAQQDDLMDKFDKVLAGASEQKPETPAEAVTNAAAKTGNPFKTGGATSGVIEFVRDSSGKLVRKQ